MNPWQITSNLVFYLNQANFKWPTAAGGTGEPILGRVAVTDADPTFNVLDQVVPSVLIRPDRTAEHPAWPADLEEEVRWAIVLYALNSTDQAGGASILGGNRASISSSMGRGILEVEPLIRVQLIRAFYAAGARPRITSSNAPVPEQLKGILAARRYDVIATRLPANPTYPSVTRLLATTTGGATLTWTVVPSRWDLVAYQVVRRAGSTPPANPTDGTVLTSTLAPTATSFVDAGGGTGNAYAVFGVYDGGVDPWTGSRNAAGALTSYSGFWKPVHTGADSTLISTFVYQPATVAL